MHIPYAHNPPLPPDIFVPDAEAHVWADGRLYIYGSLDIEGREGYCSDRYHVFSTDDLIDWVDHGVSFTTADISWVREDEPITALYAPDCAYRDGTYYLYYCIPDGRCGVAASDKPYGPFKDIGQLAGVSGIDPAVLIDDDGQAYLYWGQFDAVRVAKLKASMVEIEPETAVQPLSVAEHEFHEGASVKKINGKYYFLFTDTHRHAECNNDTGMATSLGYAVSDDPMTGFRYGGVIIDNFGCDPHTWNDHGSMVSFKGQWYVFYHRSTHGGVFSRHVCIEPITVAEDGTIAEVPMTSSGAGAAIPASSVIPAALACGLEGHARIAGDGASAHHLALCEIRPGDIAIYRYLDFRGESTMTVSLRSDGPLTVEVLLNRAPWVRFTVPASDGYQMHTLPVPAPEGRCTLRFRFVGDFDTASMDALSFH